MQNNLPLLKSALITHCHTPHNPNPEEHGLEPQNLKNSIHSPLSVCLSVCLSSFKTCTIFFIITGRSKQEKKSKTPFSSLKKRWGNKKKKPYTLSKDYDQAFDLEAESLRMIKLEEIPPVAPLLNREGFELLRIL
jgi:hypothetical protein